MLMTGRRRKKRRLALVLFAGIVILVVVIVNHCSSMHASLSAFNTSKESAPPPHLNEVLANEMSSLPSLDRDMERYLQKWEIKGGQLAWSRHDTLLYSKGYGWADKEKNIPMQPSNIMRIASVSKLVTAVGIMHLYDEGEILLSDKVFGERGILNDSIYTKTIKDRRYYDITIEHLLRHQGGFTTRAGDPMFVTRHIMQNNHLKEPPSNDKMLELQLRRRLAFTPGTSQYYSNFGYMILTLVIEKITGMDYEEYMQKEVLETAGCYDFHLAHNYYEERRDNEVKYYVHGGCQPELEYNNSGKRVEKCYGGNDIANLRGAGGWTASASELIRLIATIDLDPGVADILDEKSVEIMTEDQPQGVFSLGWNSTHEGKPWSRTGSFAGTTALVLRYPDGDCMILLTNTSTWKGHGFSKETRQFFDRLRQKYSSQLPAQDLFYP